MSNKQFETELKQFRMKLDLLVKEGQAFFNRHGDVAPHAGTQVMPHLETARNGVDQVLTPMKKPTQLFDPGD